MAAALQLEGLVTKKPRVSKYTLKPQAVSLACTLLIMRANVSPSFSPRRRHRAFQPIVSTRRAEVHAFSLEPMDCSAFNIVISSTRIRKLTSTCRTILDWQVSAFWHSDELLRFTHNRIFFFFKALVITPTNRSWHYRFEASCCRCISKRHQVSILPSFRNASQ